MDIQQWGERELRDLAAMIRHYRKAGLWKDQPDFTPTAIRSGEILVKNTETSAIPAYACMQIDGTVSEGATDDKRLYVKVKKPTGTTGSYLFNGHYEIEASGYGVGLDGPHVRGYKNSGTITLGDRWAPTSGQWYLSKNDDGPFVVSGTDTIGTNAFRLLISQSAKMDTWQSSELTMPIPGTLGTTYTGMTWSQVAGAYNNLTGISVSGQSFEHAYVGAYLLSAIVEFRLEASGGGYEPFAANEKLWYRIQPYSGSARKLEGILFPATTNAADVVALYDRSSSPFYVEYTDRYMISSAGTTIDLLPAVDVARINAAGTSQTRLDTRVKVTLSFIKL